MAEKLIMKASYWRDGYTKFKSKNAFIIKNLIEGSTLNKMFKFAYFGEITFEDNDKETQWNPICNELPDFNRNKCNALVFNIDASEMMDNCPYDKLVIYQHVFSTQGNGYYGLFWYNTKTGKTVHHYALDYTYDNITRNITTTMYIQKDAPMLQKYVNRYKMVNEMVKDKLTA